MQLTYGIHGRKTQRRPQLPAALNKKKIKRWTKWSDSNVQKKHKVQGPSWTEPQKAKHKDQPQEEKGAKYLLFDLPHTPHVAVL